MTAVTLVLTLLANVTAWAEDINSHMYLKDTTLVAIFDLAGIRKTGLFEDDLKDAFDNIINSNEQVQKVGKILNFDPSKEVTRFTICGGRQQGPEASVLLIVNGEFPYDKLVAALGEMVDKGELTSISINDLPVYFNHRARNAIYFALVDGQTVITSSSKAMIEDAIQGLTELREPAEELAGRLKWDDGKESPPLIHLIGLFPDEFRRQMATFPPLKPIADRMVAYNLVVRVEEEAEFQARLTLEDPTTAQQSVRVFKAMIELGKAALSNADRRPDIVEMLGGVKLTAKDTDLYFDVAMRPALLQQILAGNRQARDEFRERRREREEGKEAGDDAEKKEEAKAESKESES
ncbi:MAG: hypothetical protein U1D30_00845 [Planctomycetota bacterium]